MHFCTRLQALMHTDEIVPARQKERMADYKTESVDFLRAVIDATGKTASELAKLVGKSSTTFTRPLNSPDHKYAIKFQTLQALATATGVPLPQSLTEAREAGLGNGTEELRLPIRFEVAASGFEAREDIPDRPVGYRTVATIPAYPHARQWLERVVNDSMDRILPPGTELHVIDAIEIGYKPRQGDIVVVERERDQGALVERTVKQIEMTATGAQLMPRSHNPRWNRPIFLAADLRDGEDATVRIVGYAPRWYGFTDAPEPIEEP